jgi:undecaprenyl-diphosphatase
LIWLAIAAVLAAVWRRPAVFLVVAAADGVADGLASLLKLVDDERRPALRYPEPPALVALPHSSSFPSGHAATSFACATALSVLAPRLAPAFVVLACAIGYSRVYVGVHYPLDVVGGAVLGVLVGTAVLALLRRGRGRYAWLR